MKLGRFLTTTLLLTLASQLCVISPAHACPLIRKLVDYNCNQDLKIAVAGDSIVYGRGDLDNGNRGGWVKRFGPRLKVASARNIGVPGITSENLYQRLLKGFKNPNSSLRARALEADVFIIAVGVNDFYEHGDPSLTARNIKRIVAMVRRELGRGTLVTPYVLVAKLTPTTRGFQRSFVENVNRLLARYRSHLLPSYLRFDTMNEEYVSVDGVHPISSGYEQLADIAAEYIAGDATVSMRSDRPDRDRDGVFDMFERGEFGADPTLRDTDGDGLSDGKEIFTYKTDPTILDTDGDGFDDHAEISTGRDPLDALN